MDLHGRKRLGLWRVGGLLALLALLLFLLDSVGLVGGVFNRVQGALAELAGLGSGMTGVLRRSADLDQANAELTALRARNEALERENEQLRDIQARVGPALELLNRYNESPEIDRVAATVIGRGPDPLFRDLIIDKGSRDGVRVGMPVESARGLVGQVYRAFPDSAQILLVDAPTSGVPARISTSRTEGIVRGGGPDGMLTLNWVGLEAQVALNEIVVTSGLSNATPQERLSNRFPAGIVIGRVVAIQRGTATLFQEIVVQPVVDFTALETVFVVTGFTPVDVQQFAAP
jgi:rod shape-determining protein MreC